MGCEGRYVAEFLQYLTDFVANIRPDDPLPVRAPNYKVTESEIDGQILDIVHHYLNSRECPPYVREYVSHQVWMAIRNTELNGDGFDHVDTANTTNHTYDIMKLIQEVTGKANTVIQEMQSTLTGDQVEKLPRYHPISHFAIKNGRRKMEDRHVIINDLSTLYGLHFKQPHAYYGVFDGHAGIDAAVYSAAHLHQYMIQNPQYETNPEAALKHAFHITDTNFIKKASKEKLKGGTTAVVALVREKRLVVAWLGDSQALLVRRRTPVRMVEPHKPDLPVERERVEEMGGCVLNIQGTWRVLGQLAVSRAIGDREYKPFVSSECDIKSLEIEGDEDFLILACDGLWDTLSPEAAVNLVYAYLTRNDGDTDGVGRCLVEAARNTGSDDNITTVVVFLRPVSTIMEEEAQRIAQGQVPEPIPEAVLCKASTPSSINAIFSPPVNQFDHNNTDAPIYNPFEGDFTNKMDTEDAVTPASQHLQQLQEEPMEGSEAPHLSTRDSDSDEGIPAAGGNQQAFNPHEAPTPTAEEVDAALAELDSIPDEVCESGDVEEEDEEEEEWSYYRMDLQTQPQGEDVLVQGPSAPVLDSDVMDHDEGKAPVLSSDLSPERPQELKTEMSSQKILEEIPVEDVQTEDQPSLLTKSPDLFQTIAEDSPLFNKESNLMESSISNVGEYLDNYEAPSSPQAPGSPRSVEGFVTSVELNSPTEEIGGFIHAQDMNGSAVEQSSGPFSVYVSSSPEPASLDPHTQASGDFGSVTEMTNGKVDSEMEQTGDFSPVEIVHAQSTVEVLASPSPIENRESEMPDVHTSPKVPANPMEDLTFIPEPAVEPTAEKPVPVFIDESTPVSEGEPEVNSVKANMHTSEPFTADLLSNVVPAESFTMEQTCTEELAVMEHQAAAVENTMSFDAAPILEPVSPVSQLEQPLFGPGSEFSPALVSTEAEVPTSIESSPLPVSPVPEPSPKPASPLEEMSGLEFAPAEPSLVLDSPIMEPSPVLGSPIMESSPVLESPIIEPSPILESPIMESSPVLESPIMESSPVLESPIMESSPVLESPIMEPSPVPESPIMEPSPVPESPIMEPSPVPQSPILQSPVLEHLPVMKSPVLEHLPVMNSPVLEHSPVPDFPVLEPLRAPESPVLEPAQSWVPAVKEPELAPMSPVEEPAQSVPSDEPSEYTVMQEALSQASPTVLSEIIEPTSAFESKAVEQVAVSAAPEITVQTESEKDEILINTGTLVIPVVSQDIKETKPEAAKSPAKTLKTPGKATGDTVSKAAPSRLTPGKTAQSRTPTSRTPLSKSPEKKPTPTRQTPTQKAAPTRPATERATTTTTKPTSRLTATSASAKQPITKPSTRPPPRITATRSPATTVPKAAEKKTPKPLTPTAPRAALSKPSAAASKAAQPTPAARTTTAPRRPISAPAKKIEKTDSSKVNGIPTRPAPRTTSARPASASTATRKPLPATSKPVPEKETKNTTNRILSSTAKSTQRPLPGAARSISNRTTTTGQSSLTKTTKVDGQSTTTATSRAKMTSVSKSSTTSRTTGVAAKKTVVSKTSTTKTKAAAAATSSKVQKSEVISGSVANGENKIAHEETSVEVIEKCAAEDIIQCSTTVQVINTETVEVIVNGNH